MMQRARKQAALAALVLSFSFGARAGAVDLTGKWRFSQDTNVEFVDVTQSGSTATFTYGGENFTLTVGSGSFTGSAPPGAYPCSISFNGVIFPSGNLLIATEIVPLPDSCSGYPFIAEVMATRCNCYDGNTTDGDGCSAACRVEPCYTCSGTPSVCTPSPDGAACDDGHDCTAGETCLAGGCGGGSPVVPCVDVTGQWTFHLVDHTFGVDSYTYPVLAQRGGDVFLNGGAPDFAGGIDPSSGSFEVVKPDGSYFCAFGNYFDTLSGTVAPDGDSFSGSALYLGSTPMHCFGFSASLTGRRGICGDGNLDDGEACDDGNLTPGDGCDAICGLEPCWTCSGSPSVCTPIPSGPCDDGNPCTTGDACSSGSCVGTTVPDGTSCDDVATCSHGACAGGSCTPQGPIECAACTACQNGAGCVAAPRTGCFASIDPPKSKLTLKHGDPKHDDLVWAWVKGQQTTFQNLGDPTVGDDYAVCIYADGPPTTLLFGASLPAAGTCGPRPCWRKEPRKLLYSNLAATPDGIKRLTVFVGDQGKARILVRGHGPNLVNRAAGLPAPPLQLPLRVQVQAENGACFETRHTTALANDPVKGTFRAPGAP